MSNGWWFEVPEHAFQICSKNVWSLESHCVCVCVRSFSKCLISWARCSEDSKGSTACEKARSRRGFVASKMEAALFVLQTCSERIPWGGLSCVNLFHNDRNAAEPKPWKLAGQTTPTAICWWKGCWDLCTCPWLSNGVAPVFHVCLWRRSCFFFKFCFPLNTQHITDITAAQFIGEKNKPTLLLWQDSRPENQGFPFFGRWQMTHFRKCVWQWDMSQLHESCFCFKAHLKLGRWQLSRPLTVEY